ncbi:MAG: hypothetical protein K6E10_07290 [Eubacterium sp.]|nr:hypothetical protein [Eubacterium sp.]
MNKKWSTISYDHKNSDKRSGNSGAALIVAIIIITVIIIFTFSLLLVAYTYYSSQSKNVASKRCSEAANTLSLAMEDELAADSAPYSSSIWKYVRFNIFQDDTWPYYDMNNKLTGDNHTAHNEDAAFRYFTIDYNRGDTSTGYRTDDNYGETLDGFPGEVEICMYWVPSENAEIVSYDGGTTSLVKQSEINKKGAILYMEITCSAANQSYTVVNKYSLSTSTFKDSSQTDTALKTSLEAIIASPDSSTSLQYNPYKYSVDSNEKWIWSFESRE